jgi:hypothetical protein
MSQIIQEKFMRRDILSIGEWPRVVAKVEE